MERAVQCIFCNLQTIIKPTKTNRMMLRCDNCKVIIFANGEFSHEKLSKLPDYDPTTGDYDYYPPCY